MVTAAGVETQEYHYLSFEDRKELIKKTIEFVGGRTEVAVGVSHASTRTVIELANFAKDNGANAIQLLAPLRPYAGEPTTGELVDYFGAVAEKSPLPIMFYINPGPGANVSPDAAVAVSKIDKVKYVKESSRDLSRCSRLIVEIDHAGHAHYCTTMQMLLATLMLGGSGATMPPPGSFVAAQIIDAFLEKDYERAAQLQLKFARFPSPWMSKGLAPVMKAAMEAIGLPMGDPYPPFPALSANEKKALAKHLKDINFMEGRK
jgi:4-hydroxy-tetrahydrodipicolinate synthase